MRTSAASLAAEEGDTRLRVRRGLAIYFAILVPLILGGVYLAGQPPALSALLFMGVATAFSFVFARLRLETGSVWPAIALHSAWNAIIQAAFDPASRGAGATLWIGESGILVALTTVVAAVIFSRGQWTIRRVPEVRQQAGAARPALQT